MIRPNRHGTWLALFAMLMIYIGPLVSQSLMDHAMPGQWMSASSPLAGLDELACSAHQRTASQALASEDSSLADDLGELCGYCSLLIHSPPLAAATLQLDDLAPSSALPAMQITTGNIPASPVFPGSRSRAPPSLIG